MTNTGRYSANYKPQYGASRVTGARAGGFIWNVPFTCAKPVSNIDGFRWTLYTWCKTCINNECPCKNAVDEIHVKRGFIIIPDVPVEKLTNYECKIIDKIRGDKTFAERVFISNPNRIGIIHAQSKRRS